jgi:hypothetical protein
VNVRVEVNLKKIFTEDFPLTTCDVCSSLLKDSKILEAVEGVRWNLINTSTYDLEKTDPRLHQLITSVRGGLKRGFTNGQSKQISANIISVLRAYTMCPKHNLQLNVYIPSSKSEAGGIEVKVGIVKPSGEAVTSSDFTARDIEGVPDVAILLDDEPHMFVAVGENKPEPKRSWRGRESPDEGESYVGQLLIYMVGAHMQRFKAVRRLNLPQKPTPILGLYMEGIKMQSVIADLVMVDPSYYSMTMFMNESLEFTEGLGHVLRLLHKFLSKV